jgi:4-hydroxy 2-oxovalerate aldolase
MVPPEVVRAVEQLSSTWRGRIGFHGHDNLGFALLNSAYAIKSGAVQVDSTIFGMGRGAGNLRTEELMTYRLGSQDLDKLGPLYDLIAGEFKALKGKYQWGYNPVFVLSGLNNIHPDYALEIIQDAERDSTAKLEALTSIPKETQFKYSRNVLADTLELSNSVAPLGSFALGDRHSDLASALIIGPGVSDELEPAVWKFAEIHGLPVFALNDVAQNRDASLSGRFVANPSKFQVQSAFLKKSSTVLIAPLDRLGLKVAEVLMAREQAGSESVLYRTEAAESEEDESWEFTHCRLAKPLSFPYALAYLSTGGLKTLYLAGFQGYSSTDDPRYEVSARAIRRFLDNDGASLFSLTPSNYRVPKASPYGPLPIDSGA